MSKNAVVDKWENSFMTYNYLWLVNEFFAVLTRVLRAPVAC